MVPDDDPGWPRGLSIFVFLIPGAINWYGRRRAAGDGLVMLRQIFISFVVAIVLFGVVLPFIPNDYNEVVPWLPILIAVAVVATLVGRVSEKPLDCSTRTTLAGSYRTRFFLRVAWAEVVALFGFVFVFIGAATWIYYVGAAMTLALFWLRAAPTRISLARDQESLNASGCTQSLVAVLRNLPS
jgi:F0F1-type ATP synthase membrane subunit c/vacuolar-type H+-ATPase subunit K